jgi:hypothetical protein
MFFISWYKRKLNLKDTDITINDFGKFIPLRLKLAQLSLEQLQQLYSNGYNYTDDEIKEKETIDNFMEIAKTYDFVCREIGIKISKSHQTAFNWISEYIDKFYPEYYYVIEEHQKRKEKMNEMKDKARKEKGLNIGEAFYGKETIKKTKKTDANKLLEKGNQFINLFDVYKPTSSIKNDK